MNEPTAEIILGDCRVALRELPDNSIDSIVTDPPYELGFMGKGWDKSGIAYDPIVWGECLRVLKPGGHLLAFSGTRTYHRMVCAIEDAGFEVRDQVGWLYGSGFPKSLDVSKAMDKAAGVDFAATPASGVGFMNPDGEGGYNVTRNKLTRTGESTPDAQRWNGWGTALKPAWEPIVLARKPLIGTVVENVLTHGTGGLNIAGCRVGTELVQGGNGSLGRNKIYGQMERRPETATLNVGRWPANVIHDGSEEVLDEFAKYGESKSKASMRGVGLTGANIFNSANPEFDTFRGHNDTGTAARFFYCAKASKSDRDAGCESLEPKNNMRVNAPRASEEEKHATKLRNHHPTVKPTALMRYLCRLITPPGGTVLDPFTGSGSTGKAAILEGFSFIGIELSEAYADIAAARINAAGELKEAA